MNTYNSNFSDELVHAGLALTKSTQVAVVLKTIGGYFGEQLVDAKLVIFQQQQH